MTVKDDIPVTITIDMNVGELRGLLKGLEGNRAWPVGSLNSVLYQALSKAANAYQSEHEVEA